MHKRDARGSKLLVLTIFVVLGLWAIGTAVVVETLRRFS